jgi:CobQ-like glutamine amidotransferase family enzyme
MLGMNGDSGNVLALERRLHWRGIESQTIVVEPGEPLPADSDIVHIGHGPTAARAALVNDALSRRAAIHELAESGVAFLGIGAGFHLLGRSIVDATGHEQPGLGVFPIDTREVSKRSVGEVISVLQNGVRIAGFVNHGASVEIREGEPFVMLEKGAGNAGAHGPQTGAAEGWQSGGLLGTHIHGPLLPMNPSLADALLAVALERHGRVLPEADARTLQADEYARQARRAIAQRLGVAAGSV